MMQGLLDFIKTPEGQGLLSGIFGYAANARRGQPINSLGRGGIAGLLGYSNALEREQDAKQNEWLQQYRGLQMDQMRSEIEKNRQAEAERQRIDGLVRGAIGGFTPQQAIGMDASGPTQAKANMIGQPGQVDYRALYAQGVPMDKIQELVNLGNVNKTKVKNIETINIDGKPVKVGIDEYGQQVAQIGMEWKPLERVDAGGYVGLYDPTDPTGGVRKLVDKTMSPEGRDASARGWATVRQAGERLAWDKNQGKQQFVNDPERGPMMVNTTTGVASPVVGADGAPLASSSAAKLGSASKRALAVIDEAEKLIDGATGSYLGAGADIAASAFGFGTDGAKNIARLKALEGSLMMAQPRMEGPQSNMDVALYRQMAAQIGDPTVPTSVKRAALDTVKQLHEKYADVSGASGGGGTAPVKPNNNSPKVPMVGQVVDGYKFKGGNPADPKNWEAAR